MKAGTSPGEGLSHRDIAKLLGMSHANVIIIERRALAKMAKIARQEKMLVAEMFERRAWPSESKERTGE